MPRHKNFREKEWSTIMHSDGELILEALKDIHDYALKVSNGAFTAAGAAPSEATAEQALDEIIVMAQTAIESVGERVS